MNFWIDNRALHIKLYRFSWSALDCRRSLYGNVVIPSRKFLRRDVSRKDEVCDLYMWLWFQRSWWHVRAEMGGDNYQNKIPAHQNSNKEYRKKWAIKVCNNLSGYTVHVNQIFAVTGYVGYVLTMVSWCEVMWQVAPVEKEVYCVRPFVT